MTISKFKSKVIKVKDLSENAREVTFSRPEGFDFLPGQFCNLFVDIDGDAQRRAYSISSSVDNKEELSFSIRRVEGGKISQLFWDEDIVGKEFDLMGPIGVHTVDKLGEGKVFFMAMGIGISPVKSMVDYLLKNTDKKIELYFGNLNEDQILYKDIFDAWSEQYANFIPHYVLSEPKDTSYKYTGFLQDFIVNTDFTDSSVYICGIPVMADACKAVIMSNEPQNVTILEESFR